MYGKIHTKKIGPLYYSLNEEEGVKKHRINKATGDSVLADENDTQINHVRRV